MIAQLQEGAAFPPQYVLSRRLVPDNGRVDVWIATRQSTGDRVVIRFIEHPIEQAAWEATTARLARLRGLVHENISVTRETGISESVQYLVEPYLAGATEINLIDTNIWPKLKQILDALAFSHQAGIAHGNLHPGNLLVDASGVVHMTGHGVPPSLTRLEHRQYTSPQRPGEDEPSIDDDIYSLGCLLFRILAGKEWQPGAEPNLPLGSQLGAILPRMLGQSALARNVDLAEVRTALEAHYDGQSSAIESISFSRRPEPPRQINHPTTNHSTTQPGIISRQGPSVSMNHVLTGGIALIVIALLLFLFLPTDTGQPNTLVSAPVPAPTAVRNQTPAEPVITPLEAARMEQSQKKGEALAREILRQLLELEDIGVTVWAPVEYKEITRLLDEADGAYRDGRFQDAFTLYEEVRSTLDILAATVPDVLTAQLAAGNAALASGDPDAALEAFTIATAIDGEDTSIQKKLARAEQLEDVLSLVRQAEVLERNGELDEALSVFRQASRKDSLWQPAAQGVQRLEQGVRQKNFQAAMSKGFQAISRKDYEAARNGFLDAKKIAPGSPGPEDGLLQIEQAERNDVITGHQQRAEAHLKAEDWQAAIEEYEAALLIADSLEFAVSGLAVARSRLELEAQIQRFLDDPTLMQDNAGLSEATSVLREATRAEPRSATLASHIDTLARLISAARIEIPVTIVSDGLTDITVRRFAALGKIQSQVVNLIPGRYTIVGVRTGYRDVREDLVILAGESVAPISIESSERVR